MRLTGSRRPVKLAFYRCLVGIPTDQEPPAFSLSLRALCSIASNSAAVVVPAVKGISTLSKPLSVEKRTMSSAARKKIAAAQRKRWALVTAEKAS